MTGRCTLGIDAGLTSVKVAAFDQDGTQIALHRARTPRTHRDGAAIDVDMGVLWDTTATALRSLSDELATMDVAPQALGITGHGNGLYPLDEDLAPVRAGFPSTDARAEPLVRAIAPDQVDAIRALTGSVPWAAQPAALLAWMAEHEPEAYQHTRWVATCKDWLTSRLTDTVTTDVSDAAACGLLDLASSDPTPAAFELYGLPGDDVQRVPPVLPSSGVAGAVTVDAAERTGLPVGLPVVAGCMDCVASTWGAGGRHDGDLTVIMGTWAINGVVTLASDEVPEVGMCTLLPDASALLAMEVAPTSAANLEWLRDVLEVTDVEQAFEAAAAVPAGADGILYLPFLHAAGDIPAGSGSFVGLAARHGRGELTRAVLEGVAQYHRAQIEQIAAAGVAVDRGTVRLAGGGARSPLWSQIVADVLDRPLMIQPTAELGAFGVAAIARAGVEPDAAPWDASGQRLVEPNDPASYARQRTLFDQAMATMAPLWEAVSTDRW